MKVLMVAVSLSWADHVPMKPPETTVPFPMKVMESHLHLPVSSSFQGSNNEFGVSKSGSSPFPPVTGMALLHIEATTGGGWRELEGP